MHYDRYSRTELSLPQLTRRPGFTCHHAIRNTSYGARRAKWLSPTPSEREPPTDFENLFFVGDLHFLLSNGKLEHASYLSNGLRVLRGDTRAIFTAAAKAEQTASRAIKSLE